MNRILNAGFATIATLALSATLVAPASSAATSTDRNKDNKFVQLVRANTDSFDYMSNKSVIDIGKSACKVLKEGATSEQMMRLSMSTGISAKGTVALLANAVAFYCPRQINKFKGVNSGFSQ